MLKLSSWNVNGLRAVYKKGFINWLKNNDADIVCLQETKAHKEQLPEELLDLDNYSCYFSRPDKKGYSGVGLFTNIKPEKIDYSLDKKFNSEGRYIKAQYKKFTLYNVYFPNGKASTKRLNYKMAFYEAFLNEIISENKKGRGVIFCGDVNTAHQEIDLARPRQNEKVSGFLPRERAWIDRVISKGFIDTFRVFNSEGQNYTWWDLKSRARDRNVGWRLDYFFISKDLITYLQSASIDNRTMGSDHCPVSITLNF